MNMTWCAVVLLAAGCGKHINSVWCAQPGHSDPACGGAVIDSSDAAPPTCTLDSDCSGSQCLPTGACADPSAVLYVSPTGTDPACTRTAKCAFAMALNEITADRNIIVLDPATYPGAVAISRSVQIIGKLAILEAGTTGATVTVANNVTAELDYLSITGSTDASGISCTSGTLRAHGVTVTNNLQGITSACALTLDRSVINGNPGGALAVTAGAIDIRNNFIVNNGGPMLMKAPNVTIANGVTGSFAFNTVAYNAVKQNNATPYVDCESSAVAAPGNLITDNTVKGAFNIDPQVMGACDFSMSYTLPGMGANDVQWVSVAASDFHLTAASTLVLDNPTLMCAGLDDFDGQPRPMGAGCDFGADEYKP